MISTIQTIRGRLFTHDIGGLTDDFPDHPVLVAELFKGHSRLCGEFRAARFGGVCTQKFLHGLEQRRTFLISDFLAKTTAKTAPAPE